MPQFNPNDWEILNNNTDFDENEWEIVTPPVPPPSMQTPQQPPQSRGIWDTLSTAPKAITDRTRVNPERTITQDKPWGGLLEVPGALRDIGRNLMSGNPDVIRDTARGYTEGAYEGLGEMMSPINVADVATAPGKSKLLQWGNRVVSGLMAGSGVDNISEGNIPQGLAEIAGGAAGLVPRTRLGTTARNIPPRDPSDSAIQEAVETMAGVNKATPPTTDLPPEIAEILRGSQTPPVTPPVTPNPRMAPVVEAPPMPQPQVPPASAIKTIPEPVIKGPKLDLDVDELIKGLDTGGGEINFFPSKALNVPPPTAKMEGTSIIMTNPTPDIVKATIKAGYQFKGIRPDGSFEMVPGGSGKPPILESEVGLNRPTPKRAGGGKGLDDKTPSWLMEAFNFPRAVMASIDLSAPLRQGLPLIHKPQFWKSLPAMMRSFGSERAYNSIMDGILERPLFKARVSPTGKPLPSFAEEAGLKLTDLNSLTGREEHIMSKWAEKIPGVRMSNRAYTAFLNQLRADTFDTLIRDGQIFGADGKADLSLARGLADFVNSASGRGNLGKLEQSAATLNMAFFSPRLIASRLRLLNPRYYIMANPMVRQEALKSLFAVAGAGTLVTQLGRMAGGTVSDDPSSSDFGKLKIGNTRLDPYGGFQQYIVAANRLVNPLGKATGFKGDTPFTRGQMVTSTNASPGRRGKEYNLWNQKPGPYDPTWLGVAGRFGRSKAHPTLGFAISFLDNQTEMTGTDMNFTTKNPMENAVAQRFIPIFLQDLYELAKNDPKLVPIMGPLAGLGMSVQSYGRER